MQTYCTYVEKIDYFNKITLKCFRYDINFYIIKIKVTTDFHCQLCGKDNIIKVPRENNFEFRIIQSLKDIYSCVLFIYLHFYFGVLKSTHYSFDTNSSKFHLNTTLSL